MGSNVMNSVIVKRIIDELNYIEYKFFIDDLNVKLSIVQNFNRETKRHKYKPSITWNHIRALCTNPPTNQPEVPEDVINEAVNELRSRVAYKVWDYSPIFTK